MTSSTVIVIGTGLSGLVAGYEAMKAGRRVLFLDQERRADLGGQAFWSLGGLFFVGSPEQKFMRVNDSEKLAWRDWANSADYDDAPHDHYPREWGRAFVKFAAREMHGYLRALGLRIIPTIGWAERGAGDASSHGNSAPRFHVTWGTGPEVVRVFREPLEEAEVRGQVEFAFRHRVDELIVEDGAVVGVRGTQLVDDTSARGTPTNKQELRTFEARGAAVVVATGGIGGNLDKVRAMWPDKRWGPCPDVMVQGVPDYVDGSGIDIAREAGANLVNTDRMWHYPEGMTNWNPIWSDHGIRIIPGPSSLWLDADGNRLPARLFPGSDNLAALSHIGRTGRGYSWFVLNKTVADKEFIFSGSEQNPDLTDKSLRKLAGKLGPGTHPAIQSFMEHGEDWVVADTLSELVRGMHEVSGESSISEEALRKVMEDRDAQLDNDFGKDAQVNYIRTARGFLGDKIIRVAPPHKLLDATHGPLIAIRLRVLTRKTLGGIETDLDGRVLTRDGSVLPGLYACGEAAGFGGGGMHGKNALEGTFLGGCIHSGKRVGEALGRATL